MYGKGCQKRAEGEIMDNKINIMGLNLYNYFVKDSSFLIDEYLNNDCTNVIDIVQMSKQMDRWRWYGYGQRGLGNGCILRWQRA